MVEKKSMLRFFRGRRIWSFVHQEDSEGGEAMANTWRTEDAHILSQDWAGSSASEEGSCGRLTSSGN